MLESIKRVPAFFSLFQKQIKITACNPHLKVLEKYYILFYIIYLSNWLIEASPAIQLLYDIFIEF